MGVKMAPERDVISLIAPAYQRLPAENMTPEVARVMLGDPLMNLEPFNEVEVNKLSRAMEAYASAAEDDIPLKRIKVEVLSTVASLVPNSRYRMPGEVSELLEKLGEQQISIEDLDENSSDLLRVAGLLVEMDKQLRVAGVVGGSWRNELAGLSAEDLRAYQIIPEGEDLAGGINFQDPEKAARDLQEAVDKFRIRSHKQTVVYIPKDYCQIVEEESDGSSSEVLHIDDSIFIPGTRLVRPDLLVRDPETYRDGPNLLRLVPEADLVLQRIDPPLRRVVGRFQMLNFTLALLAGEGDLQQYLRPIAAVFKAEGLDAGTMIKTLPGAMQKATAFFEMETETTGDKDLSEVKRVMLSPLEMATLLAAGREVVVLDAAKDDEQAIVAAEIGIPSVVDVYWGEYGDWKVNEAGELLFIDPADGTTRPYRSFADDRKPFLVPAFVDDDNPMRPGPQIFAQQFFTQNPIKREEEGGGPWFARVRRNLERQLQNWGLTWEDVRGIRGYLFDNGKPLTISSRRIQEVIAEAGGNVKVGVDFALQTVLFARNGQEIPAAFGLAMLMQRARQADRMLAADFVPETEIAMAMREAHTAKYDLAPPVMIRMVRQYHKAYEVWKKDLMDPWMIALRDKKGFRATWRNPHNPDKAPRIKPIMYVNGAERMPMARKIASLEKNIKRLAGIRSRTGAQQAELDRDQALLNQLKRGTNVVEAVLYGKEEWGFTDVFINFANTIVLCANKAKEARAAGRNGEALEWERRARLVSKTSLRTYLENYPDLAPSASRRSQQEAMPMLMMMAQDGDMAHWLDHFDFSDFMISIGEDEAAARECSMGLQGFMLSLRNRSTRMVGLGEVDKPGKYGEKYPTLSAAYGKAMLNLIPALNNAVNSALNRFLGAKPDKLESFNPDSVPEAFFKDFYNFLLTDVRSESEAVKYMEEIVKAVIESSQGTGFLSRSEGELQLMNLLRQITMLSNAVVNTNIEMRKEFDGLRGQIGSHRAGLKILDFDENDSVVTECLRGAGFGTNYPDKQTEKKPYVSMGNVAISGAHVEFDEQSAYKKLSRKVEVLGAFGHRGAEVIALTLLLTVAKDKLLLDKYDVNTVLAQSDMSSEALDLVRKEFGLVLAQEQS